MNSTKIRDFRESNILKSRILKWLIMIKKFLLVMESKTEELTMMMKSKCETWTLTIHLRGAVKKTQLIAPPIQKLTEKHLLLKEQMNIHPYS